MREVCIHGHFYQPTRENPWTGVIDAQPSAAPFRDWNERIAAECYAPNAAARLLDGEKTRSVRNNYSGLSFDFGPTLLTWMALDTNLAEKTLMMMLTGRRGRGNLSMNNCSENIARIA